MITRGTPISGTPQLGIAKLVDIPSLATVSDIMLQNL